MSYGDGEYGKTDYGEETTSQSHLPDKWIVRLCQLLEIIVTHQVTRFFEAWAKSEGGTAKWNPLNSTLALGGTVNWTETADYNSVGVRNYKYGIVGIVATALTLQQRTASNALTFGTLLSNLRNGKLTAEQIVENSIANISLWGTNPDTILSVLKTIP